ELQEAINRANHRYAYWDTFKYQPLPPEISKEEAWAYLRLMRMASSKTIPIVDKNNHPFSYWIPESLLKYINEIDMGSGMITSTNQPSFMSNREQYIVSSLMEEAIASSQLEGAATTRKVAKEMLRTGRKPVNKSEQMILNNWLAMKHLRANKRTQLTPDFIREVHSIVTEKTLDDPATSGQFRTNKDDDIVVDYQGTTVHKPPKSDTLKDRLSALCAFANEEKPWVHPVIKATILHFCIGYEHPFVDGNGRTARALLYWHLLSRRYWILEYLSISRYFLRAPRQYVNAYVYSELDRGDLTYFLYFNLRAIRFALRDVRHYILRKQQELSNANKRLKSYTNLNSRQKALLHHALQHPEALYSIQGHRNSHGVAYDTARNDLLELEKRGMLKRQKQGKAFIFVPSETISEKLKNT
ncbi:Fic family protein, partial [Elusimicrobiota bacterium]